MDRRSLLAAALAAPVAIAVPVAAAEVVAQPSPRGDAKFWAAHAEWQAIRDEWNADNDPDEDAVWERYGSRDTEALERMMIIPVHTAMAVMAKYQAVNGADINLPFPACSSIQMLEWDLGRLCMKELR